MNVKGIVPNIGSSCVTQKSKQQVRVTQEKNDAFEKQSKCEGKKDFKTKVKEFFVSAKKNIAVVLSALVAGVGVFAVMSVKNNNLKKECGKIQEKLDNVVLPENFQEKINEKMDKFRIL